MKSLKNLKKFITERKFNKFLKNLSCPSCFRGQLYSNHESTKERNFDNESIKNMSIKIEISYSDKKIFPVGLIISLIIISSIFTTGCFESNETKLKVYHAGSLTIPFSELEKEFELENEDIDVQQESAGSAETIRKVTDLDKIADVVASADYSLIESMMIENDPKYAEYYIQFTRNQLVIAYTEKSTNHKDITKDNWFEIFQKDDVNFGFSNPNLDPCGYRALMLIQLSEIHYNKPLLFDDLIINHSAFTIIEENDTYRIKAPEDLKPDNSVMIRPKETDLMTQLETGDLDYLIIYRSVAYQHRDSHVKFLELPKEIDLSSTLCTENYSKVSLEQYSDISDKGKIIKAKPIVYGVTIPTNAKNPDIGISFVKMLLGQTGQKTLQDLGQPPIVPARTINIDKIPIEIKDLVVEI